jgi:hypothetical protein
LHDAHPSAVPPLLSPGLGMTSSQLVIPATSTLRTFEAVNLVNSTGGEGTCVELRLS